MDLIDLVLTICLLATPTSCREERLHFENKGNILNCMFQAPAQIARWSEGHPNVRVIKWRCAYPTKEINI
ncbi:hypothetical protein F3Y30_24010 (plasmid) [Sinorhizobium sp. BG8]|nr:hypothetical protein [Sinorhizobium sp. BG8]QRM57556.1 hypothetical protein F3Y30_24010 [Sinorhizobium sp. BG8]